LHLPSLEAKFLLDKRSLFIYMSEHQNKFTWGKTIINKSDLIATLAAKENLTEKPGNRNHQSTLRWIYEYSEKG
jgi:hypothetical protein